MKFVNDLQFIVVVFNALMAFGCINLSNKYRWPMLDDL